MKKIILTILSIFIIWRALLFIPIIVANNTLSFNTVNRYASLPYSGILKGYINTYPFYTWANFDGVVYLSLASKGYTVENIRYFPLYPMMIRAINMIFHAGTFSTAQFMIGFLLSNGFFIASLFVLYQLVRFDFSKKIALVTIILLLVFPTAFFFVSIYTESLFLLLSLLVFYFARKRKWWFAGIAGMLLSATRIVGICIFPILLYELYITEKKKKISVVLSTFLTPIGLVAYSIYNWVAFKDPLYFWHAQGEVANNRSVSSIVFFPQTMYRYIKILTSLSPKQFEWGISLLELTTFIISSILLFVAWKKKVRLSYILFSLLCLLIPASSGTFTGLPRYVVILFPMFMGLALVKNKLILGLYIVCSLALSFILLMYFSMGYFVA